MARVNSSHLSHCHAVLTVTEVRCYMDGSWWNSGRRALPWRGNFGRHDLRRVKGTTTVCEKPGAEVEARARRWLRSRPGLGLGVDYARGQGSGKTLIALEARARVRSWLHSRPGLWRGDDCTRGLSMFLFAAFFIFDSGIATLSFLSISFSYIKWILNTDNFIKTGGKGVGCFRFTTQLKYWRIPKQSIFPASKYYLFE